MSKRAQLAWGELRTDSGVLIKAGVVDPDTLTFVEPVVAPAMAVKLTIHWPYADPVVTE